MSFLTLEAIQKGASHDPGDPRSRVLSVPRGFEPILSRHSESRSWLAQVWSWIGVNGQKVG